MLLFVACAVVVVVIMFSVFFVFSCVRACVFVAVFSFMCGQFFLCLFSF